nr:unnamed protein product [Timema tahoe]
MAISRDL